MALFGWIPSRAVRDLVATVLQGEQAAEWGFVNCLRFVLLNESTLGRPRASIFREEVRGEDQETASDCWTQRPPWNVRAGGMYACSSPAYSVVLCLPSLQL